jgi:hypothetical protein
MTKIERNIELTFGGFGGAWVLVLTSDGKFYKEETCGGVGDSFHRYHEVSREEANTLFPRATVIVNHRNIIDGIRCGKIEI